MSLCIVNVEKSTCLFKTLILIRFHPPKRDKNIGWTVRWLRLFSSSKNSISFLNFTVLHLWTAIFRFHHTYHLLIASSFCYRGAIIAWIVISGCFYAGHLIIINCLWWLTFIFIRRTWLTSTISSLFLIFWARKIWTLGSFSPLLTWRKLTSLTLLRRDARHF
jgi:hypothetical protein